MVILRKSTLTVFHRTQLAQTIPFTAGDIAALVPGGHVVSTHVKHGRRRVHYTSLDPAISDSSAKTRTLWKARKEVSTGPSERRISSMLPHELDSIIIGYSACVSVPYVWQLTAVHI